MIKKLPPPKSKGRHLYKHGYSTTRLYGRWHGMVQRCTDPNHKNWKNYGGKGIKVCERWMTFENFFADMGEPPPGHSLDRINVDGDYEPSNCRWATTREQMRNTRNNHILSLRGRSMCIKDWADEIGIDYNTLRYRVRTWGTERALTTPKLR